MMVGSSTSLEEILNAEQSVAHMGCWLAHTLRRSSRGFSTT